MEVRITTPSDFDKWITTAEPQSRAIYHAYSITDRRQPMACGTEDTTARALLARARSACERKDVTLVQRRINGICEYLAVRVYPSK